MGWVKLPAWKDTNKEQYKKLLQTTINKLERITCRPLLDHEIRKLKTIKERLKYLENSENNE